jgi:hypothetical protein
MERTIEGADELYVFLGGTSERPRPLRISTLVEQHADSARAYNTCRNVRCVDHVDIEAMYLTQLTGVALRSM